MHRRNIPLLTAARFFAALLVVFFHYPDKEALFPRWLSSFGNEAVVFFFILSGFILTYAHAKPTDKSQYLNVSTRRFFIARLSRILPAYLIGLALAAPIFLYGFLVSDVLDSTTFFLGIALVPLFLQSWWAPAALLWNAPAWSLSVEWFFYLSFPALINTMLRFQKWRLLTSAFLLVVCVGAFRYISMDFSDEPAWHNFISYFPLMHLPQFVLGIALGLLFLRSRQNPSLNRIFCYLGLIGIALVMAFKPDNEWLSNPAVISIPFAALIYGAAGWPYDLTSSFAGRALNILGEASYSLYILHIPILLWWQRAEIVSTTFSPWAGFCSYLLLTIGLSLSTFYLVERPSRTWFFSRLSAPLAPRLA